MPKVLPPKKRKKRSYILKSYILKFTPYESKWSPEQWEEEVYKSWQEHKHWTKDRWEWLMRRNEQSRRWWNHVQHGEEITYVEEGTATLIADIARQNRALVGQ